jgi:hypothetical protein
MELKLVKKRSENFKKINSLNYLSETCKKPSQTVKINLLCSLSVSHSPNSVEVPDEHFFMHVWF